MEFFCCQRSRTFYCDGLDSLVTDRKAIVNSELAKKALEKVGNPNILVNLISRRVRQLNSAGGSGSRPLISETGNLGVADIALLEIVEGKMSFDMAETGTLLDAIEGKSKKGS